MYVESATVDLCYIWGELSCSSALAARAEMRLAALFRIGGVPRAASSSTASTWASTAARPNVLHRRSDPFVTLLYELLTARADDDPLIGGHKALHKATRGSRTFFQD